MTKNSSSHMHRQKLNDARLSTVPILALLTLIAFVTFLLVQYPSTGSLNPTEAKFTDASKSGLAIVPASGASNPCPNAIGYAINNTSGYFLQTQLYTAWIYKVGLEFCVNNNDLSQNYFIPASSTAELQSFYKAGVANQIPNVTVFLP